MQMQQLTIGDFRREALSAELGRTFITLDVHITCFQHVRRDAARRMGLSATYCKNFKETIEVEPGNAMLSD